MTGHEAKPVRVAVLSANSSYQGKQGQAYAAGISAESVGATGLWFGRITIPPGGRTKAHLHEAHESGIYLVSGDAETWFGDQLEEHMVATAGQFIYIGRGVPHVAVNRSTTEPAVALLCRTDPNEQESVVLLSELDGIVP